MNHVHTDADDKNEDSGSDCHVLEDVWPSSPNQSGSLSIVGVVIGRSFEANGRF